MNRIRLNINWWSKITDLLIVILGITVAFNMNSWKENRQKQQQQLQYLLSLSDENQTNLASLERGLETCQRVATQMDSLRLILSKEDYQDQRLETLTASMIISPGFNASTATVENIISSGDFKLIEDSELRNLIISTYNSYEKVESIEDLFTSYMKKYISPIFIYEVTADFRFKNRSFISGSEFQNLVRGHYGLLAQLIDRIEYSISKIETLQEKLEAEIKDI